MRLDEVGHQVPVGVRLLDPEEGGVPEVVELHAVHVELLEQLEDDLEQVGANAGELVVHAARDGELQRWTRNVLIRLADQPVAMLPAKLAVTRRVVRDVVVAVHPHRRQHVDARLVELPRDLRKRPAGALDQAVEVLVQPVVPHVLEVLVPVSRTLAHLRFVLVRLAVADAPRHAPDGRTGIGVDHELLDRIRRHGRGHVAQDPSVVVADDLSVLACH